MINAVFFTSDKSEIVGFEISGHSGYADSGNDIVCSAVSSACYMAANTLTDVMHADAEINVNEKIGYMSLTVDDKYITMSRDILTGLKMHLILLEELYPENIKVKYMEV